MSRRLERAVALILVSICLLIALGACVSRTTEPATPTPEVFNPLPPEQRAFEAVREALARQLGLDPLKIQLVETVPVDWPDSCLGLPGAGESCAQVVTPGFRVVVEASGTSYEFRTNRDGNLVRSNGQ